MVLALRRRKVLRSVVVVLHVRNSAAKGHLLSMLSLLNWVSQDVTWLDQYFTWVLLTAEVLLNLNKVSHVLVRWLDFHLDHALRLERLLISHFNLTCSVFLAGDVSLDSHVRITDRSVSHPTDQDLIDGGSFLHWVSPDVGWVNKHFLRIFTVWVHASCKISQEGSS